MWLSLASDILLLTAYLLASASCLSVRSRLYGGLLSRDFGLMALAWSLGFASTTLGLILKLMGPSPLTNYAILGYLLSALSSYVPLLMASVALAHMAMVLSRFPGPPEEGEG